jgi:Domain of unknown function (DUF6875)
MFIDQGEREPTAVVDQWLRGVIAMPHPKLGRRGAVCPFVPRLLADSAIQYHMVGSNAPRNEASVCDAVTGVINRTCHADQFSTIVLCPYVPPSISARTVLAVHARLKSAAVSRGLMLGEFYPGAPNPGIRNSEFRPLDSPVPMLVVRPMVRSDHVFLKGAAFMSSYHQFFPRA